MITRTARKIGLSVFGVMMLTAFVFTTPCSAGFVSTLQIEQGRERIEMEEQASIMQSATESAARESSEQTRTADVEPSA